MGDDMQEEAMMIVLGLLFIESPPDKRKDCGESPGDDKHAFFFFKCLPASLLLTRFTSRVSTFCSTLELCIRGQQVSPHTLRFLLINIERV